MGKTNFSMKSHATTAVIADDHTLVAEACKKLLEPEFKVVAIVADGRSLLEKTKELRPDVVITDIAMPHLNGLDAGEQIKQQFPSIKLVYLTMNTKADVAAEAFRRGASGYVVKHCSAEELVVAIRRVLRNESYLSPMITRDTVDFLLRSGSVFSEQKRLSSRQREVLQLLAEGKSMKEIAYILNLKPGTVAFHKYRIMETIDAKTNAELIEYAIKTSALSA